MIVNVSRWRCDALILANHAVTTMPLADLTEKQVIDETNRYLQALQDFEHSQNTVGDRIVLETAVAATLEWLWVRIAIHILDRLGHTSTPTGTWPRLLWCPTGALTIMPLHAAGRHHGSERDSVCDRVVSSYTPTLRALANARTPRESQHKRQLLVVALPNTPQQSGLPGAIAEQKLLTELFEPPHRTILADTAATREAVITNLNQHRWFHACCHGTQNLDAPSEGGLIPYDWASAGLVAITDLTNSDHTGGEFAFLSACKTATGGVTNVDEVITIAAAMQHAGWRHVIGTLWTVWDRSAAAVAKGVYSQLAARSTLTADTSAHALHHTIRKLRDAHPDHPSTWAPFIHIGP